MAYAVTSNAAFVSRRSETGTSSTKSQKTEKGFQPRAIQRASTLSLFRPSYKAERGVASSSRGRFEVTARQPDPVMVPAVPMFGGEQMMDVMSYLRQNRIIFIGEPITDKTCLRVTSELLAMEYADPDAEVALYINSIDGVMYSTMALVDLMQTVKCPISTVCFGMCGGLSTLLLSAGKKGRRFAMPNSRIMIHQPMGGAAGSSMEVSITATEVNRNLKVINMLFSEYTGLTTDQMEEEIDRENYMSPQQAIDMGFIDAMC
mmetsp:Transcript_38632/g.46767  ORF Transcript_38632/g.46767 Transcript_38632/m.46767 type:complete len:261 (-) Transcript_38632:500-1282(-)|eukprot:CAMPEP_0197848504 /NCGR_PEP_ID=MMETSP1438-20131217/8936_1 /TAXON_ID=1461541 /ORGANISM="Pterosperma sp., Strain CCMP1384" /LENGTH=260 /DNA_ID=CAMNT_0043460781 /DNA_START=44 /DNA_END=826 /DNA_ORIENTATION=+